IGCAILSVTWVVHVCLNVFPAEPISPFLDAFLAQFSNAEMVTIVLYSLLSLYLLFAVIKGTIKFGFRFLLFAVVHPMQQGKTFLNSFLFNVGLMLLSSLAVVEFCATAFSTYFKDSTVDLLFNNTLDNLAYVHYFFDYASYVMLGFAVLTLLILVLFPGKGKHEDQIESDLMQAGKLAADSSRNMAAPKRK
ncbi:LMBR1-like membrane protein, partial [Kipferlia bialata]